MAMSTGSLFPKLVPVIERTKLPEDGITAAERVAAAGVSGRRGTSRDERRHELDRGSLGPLVDPALRTTRRGVFAAGNLLHPAETADVCALDGRHVAPSVAAYLRGPGEWPSTVRLAARAPLAWVAPNLLLSTGHPPPRDRFLLRSTEFVRRARLQVRQGGRELWSGRVGGLVPGRSSYIPANWASQFDPEAGPVVVAVK